METLPTLTVKSAGALSGQGRRNYNQDSFFPKSLTVEGGVSKSNVFIVCDGVGGLDGGEHASRIVSEVFGKALKKAEKVSEDDIHGLVEDALAALRDFDSADPAETEIASTLALAHVGKKGLMIVHVGDSRVQVYRESQLVHQTQDHSFVQEMVNRGMLTLEEARNHPKRNVITQAISSKAKHVRPDIYHLDEWESGDVVLICSDGVLEAFSDGDLTSIAHEARTNLEAALSRLSEGCEERSSDNYTAVLLVLDEYWVPDAAPETTVLPKEFITVSEDVSHDESSAVVTQPVEPEEPEAPRGGENSVWSWIKGKLKSK
jgi:protein phosphatase